MAAVGLALITYLNLERDQDTRFSSRWFEMLHS